MNDGRHIPVCLNDLLNRPAFRGIFGPQFVAIEAINMS